MTNLASTDPFDAPQVALGATILATGQPGSLQTAADLINHVFAESRLVLGVWPQGQPASGVPYETDGTGDWEDWISFRVHVPAKCTLLRFIVRSARLTGDTMQIRLSSDVDAGMAAGTTITPNTAGSLTPTTQTVSHSVTPGDQTLTVQYRDDSSPPGSSAVYAVAVVLDPVSI
jgi:hypothetical protein